MLWILVALGLSILYILLLFFYRYHWDKIPDATGAYDPATLPGVSVVIVAHDEAASIGTTLTGLLKQHYPSSSYEVIVVDDHSTDATAEILRNIRDSRIHYVALRDHPEYIHPPAFKKSGIALAVDKAQHPLIVLTDADCTHPEPWLMTIAGHFQEHNAVFQTAPVILTHSLGLMGKMQEMEQLILMLITAAGIRSGIQDMANGANMAFTKRAFQAVHGFDGNYTYASGDDMFLIEKMRASFPHQVAFAKTNSAAVYTNAKPDWNSLFKQRLRWAGKNRGLHNKNIDRIWSFVGLYHVVMVLFLSMGILPWISFWPGLIMLVLKWMADYMIVRPVAVFFQRKELLRYFIPLQVMYTYYILRLGWMMWLGKKDDWQRKSVRA